MAPAIIVDGLVKDYGEIRAVDGISFEVAQGEVFALLGPNGAGKTTTVEILEGHRRASAGSVRVLGMDPAAGGRAYRDRIGIVLQSGAIERELTPREVVRAWGRAYPAPRDPEALLDLVGLSEKGDARIGTLSGGQQRRLDLALGLVGDPEVVFLDEPTTGFDPAARRESWRLVERLAELGKTVLLTTHYLDEAQHLAERVGVVVRGRLVALGRPAELGRGRADLTAVRFRLPVGMGLDDLPVAARPGARLDGPDVEIMADDPTPLLNDLTSWALARGSALEALTVSRPDLEDVYLDIVAGASGDDVHAR